MLRYVVTVLLMRADTKKQPIFQKVWPVPIVTRVSVFHRSLSSRFIQLNDEQSAASSLRRGTKTDEWKGEKWSGISIMSVSGKKKKKRKDGKKTRKIKRRKESRRRKRTKPESFAEDRNGRCELGKGRGRKKEEQDEERRIVGFEKTKNKRILYPSVRQQIVVFWNT